MESQSVEPTYTEALEAARQVRSERLRQHHALLTYLFSDDGKLAGVVCSCSWLEMNLKAWKIHIEKAYIG